MPKATKSATSTRTRKTTTTTSAAASKTKTASKTTTKTASKTNYTNNGVSISPSSYSTGDRIKICYSGLLVQSGANDIYAHVGYGTSKWSNVSDIKMTPTKNGFETTLPISSASLLNIAFKDSADNWDNNSGNNYCFKAAK